MCKRVRTSPALYVLQGILLEGGSIRVLYERCIECGACPYGCPYDNIAHSFGGARVEIKSPPNWRASFTCCARVSVMSPSKVSRSGQSGSAGAPRHAMTRPGTSSRYPEVSMKFIFILRYRGR